MWWKQSGLLKQFIKIGDQILCLTDVQAVVPATVKNYVKGKEKTVCKVYLSSGQQIDLECSPDEIWDAVTKMNSNEPDVAKQILRFATSGQN